MLEAYFHKKKIFSMSKQNMFTIQNLLNWIEMFFSVHVIKANFAKLKIKFASMLFIDYLIEKYIWLTKQVIAKTSEQTKICSTQLFLLISF